MIFECMAVHIKTTTIKNIVQSKLNKCFEENVQGNNGWQYAKQSTWKPVDIFERLEQACFEKSSIEDVCSDFSGCSADTVQSRINDLDFDQTVKQINACLRDIYSGFRFHGNQTTTLAIDITDKEYYGNHSHELSVGSKPKNGTSYFNRYFTASIITENFNIPVYYRPLRQQDSLSPDDLIQEMLDELFLWLPVKRILGDAYFYSKEVIATCDFHGYEYLFKMSKYTGVKKAIAVIQETLAWMASAAGIDTSDVKGFYRWIKKNSLKNWKIPNPAGQDNSPPSEIILRAVYQKTRKRGGQIEEKIIFYTYVTNIKASVDYITKLYGTKWGIETGYRVENQFQAFTTSQYTSMRIWLTGLGFIMVALWLFLNLLFNRYQEELPDPASIPFSSRVYNTDVLFLTAKRFIRRIQQSWREKEGF